MKTFLGFFLVVDFGILLEAIFAEHTVPWYTVFWYQTKAWFIFLVIISVLIVITTPVVRVIND